MPRTVLWRAAAAAPVSWVALLAVAAFIAGHRNPGVTAYGLSAAVYEIGSLICHQRPERSFHLWGAQLAVCARCAGIYLGAAAAAGLAPFTSDAAFRTVWSRATLLLAAFAAPTAATLVFEWITGIMPSHAIRASAGFPLGVIVMLVVLAGSAVPSAVEIH